MLCSHIKLYHIHMPGLAVNPAHGIMLLHYRVRSTRDGGRTFSFIGLPEYVIVLSVSIGPRLLSRVVVYCSVTANARVHYPHPSLLKTSRTDRHMKECQQVYCIIP